MYKGPSSYLFLNFNQLTTKWCQGVVNICEKKTCWDSNTITWPALTTELTHSFSNIT